jgi:hypothetical protein
LLPGAITDEQSALIRKAREAICAGYNARQEQIPMPKPRTKMYNFLFSQIFAVDPNERKSWN